MPSAIDETKPVTGNPTTLSVRNNFAAAKSEIEAIQTTLANGLGYTNAEIDQLLLIEQQNRESIIPTVQAMDVQVRADFAAADTAVTTALAATIASENANRVAEIAAEATTRSNSDTVLSGQLTTLQTAYTLADTNIISALNDHSPIVLNGGMRIASRAATFTAAANLAYTLDRWQYLKNGTMVHTIAQDTDAPSLADAGHKITHSIAITLTTAQPTLANGNFSCIRQIIEGSRFQRIAHQPTTISFWVKCSVSTRFPVVLRNSNASQNFVKNVQINTTNVWQRVSFQVPAHPEAGTWLYDTGAGLELAFSLGAAPNLDIAPDAWSTTPAYGSQTDTIGYGTVGQVLKITDVRIQPGTTDHPFIMPPLDIEHINCLRYYWHTFPSGIAAAQNAGTPGALHFWQTVAGTGPFRSAVDFPAAMRAAPAVTFYNPSAANALWRNQTRNADSGAASIVDASTRNVIVINAGVAADTAKSAHRIHAAFSAEY